MSDDKRSFEQLVIQDLGTVKQGIQTMNHSFQAHVTEDATNFGEVRAQITEVKQRQNESRFMLKGASKVFAITAAGVTLIGGCLGIVWVGMNIMEKF